MSELRDLVRMLKKNKPSGSDYTGTVTRCESGMAYVQLTGSDIMDTPVVMSVDCKPGDKVRVRVNDGRAWITGNDTTPPSNDKKEVATKMSRDMANRSKHIIIKDGTIKFIGKTLIVESENFKLDEAGNATFGGTLDAAGGTFSGAVTFEWGADNPSMHQRVHIGDSTINPLIVEAMDSADDSSAALDAWGVYSSKDEGRIFAQLTAEYGLQVSERTASQQGIGIDCGYVQGSSVAANSYADYQVDFNFGFANTPIVVVGFYTGSTAGAFGRCCCSVTTKNTWGFTIRVFNGDTTSRSPSLQWIAIGQ